MEISPEENVNEDNVYTSDIYGSYPIHRAAENGDSAIVAELIRKHPQSIYLLNRKRRNFLHVAARRGHVNVVKLALGLPWLGFKLDRKDANGDSVLHLATSSWHPDVVRVLTLDKRVKKDALNSMKRTALDISELNLTSHPPVPEERLTWEALNLAKVPRRRRSCPFDFQLPYELEIGWLGAILTSATLFFNSLPLCIEGSGEEKAAVHFIGKTKLNFLILSYVIAFFGCFIGASFLCLSSILAHNVSSGLGRLGGITLTVGLVSQLIGVMIGLPLYLHGVTWFIWGMRLICIMGLFLVLLTYLQLFFKDPLSDGIVSSWLGGLALDWKLWMYKLNKDHIKYLKAILTPHAP